jgi:hypothetical protein
MDQARILTFGYKAFFKTQDQDIFNISSFAKNLLLQLKVGTTSEGNPLNIGKVIFKMNEAPEGKRN